MLTENEIIELFRLPESDDVERKEGIASSDKICEAICAFANDLPGRRRGVIFVGQRDDRSCAGLNVDVRLLETLASWRSDGRILPFPHMSVRKMAIDGCDVAVIDVAPTDNPPVRFNGRVWIRVGPRRGIATAEEERRLVERRRWGNLPFDAQPVRGATLAHLDLRRFDMEYLPVAVSPEALAENARTRDMQLRALRLVGADGTPTAMAILLLGVDPRTFFPGAYVQFLRIDGTQLTDQLKDQREISGTLGDQLRELEVLMKLHIARAAFVGGATREERPDYPEDALRQIARNAVLHRSYEGTNAPVRVTWFADRIEIQSPGGPYGQVTKETFGEPGVTDYRNPTIAEALKALGFVERFGMGIPVAQKSLGNNGNPPLEFTVEDAHVLVTVRRRP